MDVVGTGRVELPTYRLGGGCSIQLSYVPTPAHADDLLDCNRERSRRARRSPSVHSCRTRNGQHARRQFAAPIVSGGCRRGLARTSGLWLRRPRGVPRAETSCVRFVATRRGKAHSVMPRPAVVRAKFPRGQSGRVPLAAGAFCNCYSRMYILNACQLSLHFRGTISSRAPWN
jgi:hypothetical protein